MSNRRYSVYCHDKYKWEDDDILIKPDGRVFRKFKMDGEFRDATSTHEIGMTVNVKLESGKDLRAFELIRYERYKLMDIYGALN